MSINVFGDGDGHAWHFDESAFSVTLMLQAPEEGGDFEYIRDLRDADDPGYGAVAAALDGHADGIEPLALLPGTLAVFAGRRTLHRVRTVRGARERLVAVLCYASRPGVVNSPAVRRLFWGREA